MPNFDSIDTKKNELIRKSLDGAVYAGASDAAELTAEVLFDPDTGELTALPEGYRGVGYLSDDGATFSRDTDSSDIMSWGSNEPTRSDVTQDTTTLQMACQETNRETIAAYVGVDPSTLSLATNGSLTVDKPGVGKSAYRRVFSIGVDLDDGGEIYVVRFLPRAKVTEYDDQAFANGDDPLLWPVTYTAYTDSALGYSERFLFGGPGWKALAESMGFQTAA